MPLLAWASSRPFDDLILIENEWHQFEGLWAGELIWKDVDPDTIDPKTTKRLNDWKTFQDKYVSHVSSGDRFGFIGIWEIRDDELTLTKLVYINEARRLLDPDRDYGAPKRPPLPIELILGEKQLPLKFEDLDCILRVPIDGWTYPLEHWPSWGPSLYQNSLYLKVERGKVVERITVKETEIPELHFPGPKYPLYNPYLQYNPFDEELLADLGDWKDLRELKYMGSENKYNEGLAFRTRGILKREGEKMFSVFLPPSMVEKEGFEILLNQLPSPLKMVSENLVSEILREDPFGLSRPPVFLPVELQAVYVRDGDLEYLRVLDGKALSDKESVFKYSFRVPNIKWKVYKPNEDASNEKSEEK
jgi:hypothetical protein